MKYKDYYAVLGLERSATAAQIKGAYRKLAHRYHPDVSKDPAGEAKFKELAEAYQTLKDAEKRTAYDQLGTHQTGQEFQPPPDWNTHFGGAPGAAQQPFSEADLAELVAGLSSSRQRGNRHAGGHSQANLPMAGRDFDVNAESELEDACRGTQVDLNLRVPDFDEQGRVHLAERSFKARIPKGVNSGQRLRLRGQGGKGRNGGPDGNLYLNIALRPHPLFRVSGHDLFLDLPLAPWEAALGTSIDVPTLEGSVSLRVPPSTASGRQLRLVRRGLPKPHEGAGDLFAVVQIVMPVNLTERQTVLLKDLAEVSSFDPRSHFRKEAQSVN